MLVAGNWKMYKGPAEAERFCRALAAPAGVDVVVCPPYVSLAPVVAVAGQLGGYAQNGHWAADGA